MSSTRPRERLKGMAISDVSIQQPVFVTMMMLLAVVIGLLAYRSLPVNNLPDFSVPTVSITISYTGAGPETIAQEVVEPIEETLNTLSGVDTISSTASEGQAQISITFLDTVDTNQAIQDVREKVNAVVPSLPDGTGDPVFVQFDSDAMPVLQVAVASDGSLSPLELRQLIDDTFSPAIQRMEGVGSVTVSGGEQRQINVLMDLSRLSAYQVIPSQISSAISSANTNLGLGNMDSGDQNISLRAPTQIQSLDDIGNLRISGSTVRISDLAKVEDGVDDISSYERLNGEDAISISVVKQAKANTVTVAKGARMELERLFAAYPHLSYLVTSDQSVEVEESVTSSIEEMVLAVIAALLVVLFFFRDLRNTLVTMAGLPVIMILTFAAMVLFGITINIISLLALSLAVGLVIDDAIVVRENIFRYMERGYSPIQAASRATAEVALSVVAMTLTVVAVFLPVALTSGTTGAIFKAFGLTVASAMMISLVEAFTFAPMLSANLFGNKYVSHHGHHVTQPDVEEGDPDAALVHEASEEVGWMGRFYARLLGWSLTHRMLMVGITILVLVVSIVVASGMKVSFLPSQASDSFTISYELPLGSSLEKTNALAKQAEAIIMVDPDVVSLQSSVGGTSTPEQASFTVNTSSSDVSNTVRERLRPQLNFLPNLIFSAQSFSGNAGTGVSGRTLQIKVRSTLPASDLESIATQIETAAQAIPGLVDVGSSYETGRPEVQFYINQTLAGDLGITSSDLASSVRALVNGDTATSLRQGDDDVDVVVKLASGQRADIDDLNAISLLTSNGSVPLSSVAKITMGTSPSSLKRADLQNEIIIGANVARGSDQMALQSQLQAVIDKLDYPHDQITISFGGDQENINEGFGSLYIAMGLSVLFVYMVLASQFGSFSQPFVIMLAMPFSFIGAFVALRISGMALDITGMIGLIMLMGLVVKNSILLVDFTNKLRASGLDKHMAIVRAGAIRLRPILMTSTAVIAGAIPTAFGIHFFSSGDGGEFRRSLAIVLIGGMLTSTMLTLLVVPTAYSLIEAITDRLGRFFHRKGAAQAAATSAIYLGTSGMAPATAQPQHDGGTLAHPTSPEVIPPAGSANSDQ